MSGLQTVAKLGLTGQHKPQHLFGLVVVIAVRAVALVELVALLAVQLVVVMAAMVVLQHQMLLVAVLVLEVIQEMAGMVVLTQLPQQRVLVGALEVEAENHRA
jgi:hypothetical protein